VLAGFNSEWKCKCFSRKVNIWWRNFEERFGAIWKEFGGISNPDSSPSRSTKQEMTFRLDSRNRTGNKDRGREENLFLFSLDYILLSPLRCLTRSGSGDRNFFFLE
jgi:hypothetical protein